MFYWITWLHIFLFIGSLFCAVCMLFLELSEDGRSQDAKTHDGHTSAGAATEEQGSSRDGSQAAADVAVEDDVAQDEDGKTSLWSWAETFV